VSVQITIDVVDIEPPVLTVPTTAFTAIADPDTGTASVDYSASVSAFDNVDLDITIVCDPPSGSTFPIGDTTVSCTASDDGPNETGTANTDTKTFVVTVNDETAPVISLTGLSAIALEEDVDVYDEQGATVSDSGDLGVAVVIGGATVDTTTAGTYVVTYDATDEAGNLAVQVTRTVTVSDSIAPVITLLGGTPVTVEVGSTYSDAGATVADIGDSTVTVLTGGDTVLPGTVGTYVVTYNATDAAGNPAAQITRTVNVIDTTAPVITLIGAANITLEAGVDTYTEPGAAVSDVGDPLLTTVSIGGDTVDPNAVGTYLVTYNSIDASGISAAPLTRTVTVSDTLDPVITLTGAASITLETGVDSYTELGATVADDGDPLLATVSIGGDTVDPSTAGTYVVTYDATDASGNPAVQVTRTVYVADTTAPVITAPNVEVRRDYYDAVDPDWARIAVAEYTSGVVASDVADGPITLISCDRDDDPDPLLATDFEFSDAPYGITCTAEDSAGNVGTGSFELTILYSYDINLIPPKGRARAGSTVPLDWQYLDQGALVNSSAVDVRVAWAKMTNSSCTVPDLGTPGSSGSSGLGDDSGFSDFRYSASSDTWQFSWQTPDITGNFKISVSPSGANVETAWKCIKLR
jgi:hypothetical protein